MLESVGQYSGYGPIRAYKYLAPFFHGKSIEYKFALCCLYTMQVSNV